jgi:hypothetical protein
MRRGARDIIVPASAAGTAATAGDGFNIIAAGTQTANTTGTVVFSNSNGLAFGMTNNSIVTGSYTVPTVTNSSMTVSDAATSGTLARLAFTNLNGVTLSLSSGAGGSHTIVGSHNALTSQSTDFNAITLGGNTAGTTTFHATNNRTIFLNGGNNITLSGNGSTITISGAAQTVQTQNLVALIVSGANGNATFTSGTVSVKVGADITLSTGANVFSIYGNSTVAQSNQTVGLYASSNTTGESSSSTFDARSISFIGKGVASVGFSGSQVVISVPSGGGAGDGGNTIVAGTRTATSSGAVVFSNSNGITFGLDNVNGSIITASYTVPTVTNSSWTVSDSATSATVGRLAFTASNGLTLTLSTSNNGNHTVIGSYTVPTVTNSSWTVSDSATSATVGRLAFTASNGLTLTLSTSNNGNHTVIGSYTVPTVTAGSDTAGISNLGNTAGTSGVVSGDQIRVLFAGGDNITLSQSLDAGNKSATITILGPVISLWQNNIFWGPLASAQGNSLVSMVPMYLPVGLACSHAKHGMSINVGTAANNSSAYVDVSASLVVYTRNASTLSSIFSGSMSTTATFSSNATSSITGQMALKITFNATTLTPGNYYYALHVSTNNTATGGANTTALGNSISMLGLLLGTANFGIRNFGVGTNDTQGQPLGQGMVSTGATVASIPFSSITASGSRGALALIGCEFANVSVW